MEVNPSQAIFIYFKPLFTEDLNIIAVKVRFAKTMLQVPRKRTGCILWTVVQATKLYCCDRYKLTNKSCFTEPPLLQLQIHIIYILFIYVCSTRNWMQLIGTKAVNKCFCTLHEVNLSNIILYVILPSVHLGPEHYYSETQSASCQNNASGSK